MSFDIRQRYRAVLVLALALLAGHGAAPPSAQGDPESRIWRALGVEAQGTTGHLGVHVVDVDTGETVYAHRPDEPRIIASNAKIFTTAAALDALGAGYFFETRFLLSGEVRDGVLRGDLGVVGDGDPNISGRTFEGDPYGAFRDWARHLRVRGIRKVEGDLYLAHGLFDGPLVHPDWPRDQLANWYEAPVEALSFNDNCILVRIHPGRAGGRARVETVPSVPLFQVDNRATTTGKGGSRLTVHRTDDELIVRGSIRAGTGPFETWVTVPDPVDYFGRALRDALAAEGIEVAGRLRPVDALPPGVWERVSVFRSDLLTAVRVTNKRSQNFYAESLAKKLGALRCGRGDWDRGVQAVAEWVVSTGVPRGAFEMADGSGMSRGNRFAPRHLTTVLRHMYFHPLGSEFVQSLPYGGEDVGSWDRRLATPPYRGNVFAKTGTLRGVSALSGYAKAVSGRTYAFSILINDSRGNPRGDQDRIVKALVDHG